MVVCAQLEVKRLCTSTMQTVTLLLSPALGISSSSLKCTNIGERQSSGHVKLRKVNVQADSHAILRPRYGTQRKGSSRRRATQSAGAEFPAESSEVSEASGTPQQQEERRQSLTSIWRNWQTNAAELRAQVAKLGLAAVLAYGLFDGVTYTSFFVLAFLGYEKSTGQNPATNLKALLGVVILMWTGNNVTRPLRVAGAAALAPLIDKFLKKTQKVLKLPNQAFAFMIVVASFASFCFSIVGLLILSRLGS